MKHASPGHEGYTLVEMVTVISLLSLLGLLSSFAVMAATRVYARVSPSMEADYQAELAIAGMKRELRGLRDAASITTFTATALAFRNAQGQPVDYRLSGSDLRCNGDLLARGVAALDFKYWRADGTPAATAASLRLIEITLTTQVGGQSCRIQASVHPRVLGS